MNTDNQRLEKGADSQFRGRCVRHFGMGTERTIYALKTSKRLF
jgi:hypothetical protein